MIIYIIILLLFGLFLFFLARVARERSMVPAGDVMYTDSQHYPGELLHATSVPLVGKPDFILKKGKDIIPVEIKRGKTPQTPYRNHVAQLFAYCLLIEEHYKVRPTYGIIRYPDKEFSLEFPIHAENHLREAVNEMIVKKTQGVTRTGLTRTCKVCLKHV